jgi:fluoride ion exporter CrcB/FEX
VQAGAHVAAALHVLATVVGCLLAGAAGWWLGRRLFAPA